MVLNQVRAQDLVVGMALLFNGRKQNITKIEPTMYGSDIFITLEHAGTGVWGKRDWVTVWEGEE